MPEEPALDYPTLKHLAAEARAEMRAARRAPLRDDAVLDHWEALHAWLALKIQAVRPAHH